MLLRDAMKNKKIEETARQKKNHRSHPGSAIFWGIFQCKNIYNDKLEYRCD